MAWLWLSFKFISDHFSIFFARRLSATSKLVMHWIEFWNIGSWKMLDRFNHPSELEMDISSEAKKSAAIPVLRCVRLGTRWMFSPSNESISVDAIRPWFSNVPRLRTIFVERHLFEIWSYDVCREPWCPTFVFVSVQVNGSLLFWFFWLIVSVRLPFVSQLYAIPKFDHNCSVDKCFQNYSLLAFNFYMMISPVHSWFLVGTRCIMWWCTRIALAIHRSTVGYTVSMLLCHPLTTISWNLRRSRRLAQYIW